MLFTAFPPRIKAQSLDSLQLLKVYTDSLSDFEVDNLGNLYLVGRQQQIKKISLTFDSIGLFNDKRNLGKLYSIDVSNPLRVLLFYKDFATIVILDRFLQVRTILNLRNVQIQQVSAITQSYDNNIWLYDELDNDIKKIDESGRVLLRSPDFRVLFDMPPQPKYLQDLNRYLYAYDSSKGLLLMDYFGAYRNLITYTGWQNIHGISKGIVATDSTGLIFYQPYELNVKKQALPAAILNNAVKIRVFNAQLFVLDKKGILMIYKLP
jgi:hypothetical protein